MSSARSRTTRVIVTILSIIIALVGGMLLAFWLYIRSVIPTAPATTFSDNAETAVVQSLSLPKLFEAAPTLLGMEEPQTYLFLLKNNTEIRPGGGFIGSYALVTLNQGQATIHKIDGSEVLDAGAPDSWQVRPPEPIRQYLGVPIWYFRDSNWSPDFPTNAERALQFYAGEGGDMADEIDAVIAVNTNVFTKLFDIIGPITVQNQTFNSENAIEVLQYDVHFGFVDRGVSFEDRKQILDPLLDAIVARVQGDILFSLPEYLELFSSAVTEQDVTLYSRDPELQALFASLNATGVFAVDTVDVLHWSDANLGSLKSDKIIGRDLTYIVQQVNDRYVGTATMNYTHNGRFDQFTTRYQSYVRVYVPQGAQLLEVTGEAAPIDQGVFGEYQWFGTYITFEPGTTHELSVSYVLPMTVERALKEDRYDLTVVKQSGVNDLSFTLNNDIVDNELFTRFGTPVARTAPIPFTETLLFR